MKKITNKITVTILFCFIVLFANAQTFEGEITYRNSYQSKLTNLKSEQLNAMMGNPLSLVLRSGLRTINKFQGLRPDTTAKQHFTG